jgi:ERO1-like protein alpha
MARFGVIFLVVFGVCIGIAGSVGFVDALQCQLCEVSVKRKESAVGCFLPPCSCLQSYAASGNIDDCCCDIETADRVNEEHFLPVLSDLTTK